MQPCTFRYTLAEDIPEGHTTLLSKDAMMPAQESVHSYCFDRPSAS